MKPGADLPEHHAVDRVPEADVVLAVTVEVADERLVLIAGGPLVAHLVGEPRAVLDEEDPVNRMPQADVHQPVAVEVPGEGLVLRPRRPRIGHLTGERRRVLRPRRGPVPHTSTIRSPTTARQAVVTTM